jgi:type I restriction enzyme S subunit
LEGKLPEGWEWIFLNEVVDDFVSGGTPSTKIADFWCGDIPWITSAAIDNFYLHAGERHISIEGLNNSASHIILKGNVIVATRVGIGKAAVNLIDVAINQDLTGILVDKKKIMPEFLARFLLSPKLVKSIVSVARGTTIRGLKRSDLEKTKVPLPPLETQCKIVAILDKAEQTSRLRAQADELTGGLIQSAFLEIFGDPIKNSKGWSLKDLDSVCDEIYRYPTFYGFKYVPEGIPVLKISNMNKNKDGTFIDDISTYDKVPKDINEKFPRTIVKEGDIVMEARGTYIGTCAIVTKKLEGSNISPNTIRISPSRDKILPQFLLYISLTNAWKKEIETRVRYWKAGFGTIKSSEIKNLKILCPPIELQNHFVESVDSFKRLQQSQRQSQQNIDALFGALMQEAFTGELVA